LTANWKVWRARAVHIYTALGLICAFFASLAIIERDSFRMFVWLGVALIIDSTDGMLARKFEVWNWTPHFDGRKLDDITDYLNYTFVPAVAMYRFGAINDAWVWVLPVVLLSSVYAFCMDVAKTDDGYFTGWPSYWNVLLFYMFVFQTSVPLNAIVLIVLSIGCFIPMKYLYPSKTKLLKPITLLLSASWFVIMILMLVNWGHIDPLLLYGSLVAPAYYLLVSFYVTARDGLVK
jgi:phosphatidylcholine synthase